MSPNDCNYREPYDVIGFSAVESHIAALQFPQHANRHVLDVSYLLASAPLSLVPIVQARLHLVYEELLPGLSSGGRQAESVTHENPSPNFGRPKLEHPERTTMQPIWNQGLVGRHPRGLVEERVAVARDSFATAAPKKSPERAGRAVEQLCALHPRVRFEAVTLEEAKCWEVFLQRPTSRAAAVLAELEARPKSRKHVLRDGDPHLARSASAVVLVERLEVERERYSAKPCEPPQLRLLRPAKPARVVARTGRWQGQSGLVFHEVA